MLIEIETFVPYISRHKVQVKQSQFLINTCARQHLKLFLKIVVSLYFKYTNYYSIHFINFMAMYGAHYQTDAHV